jgi:hypothetical protein
MTTEEELLAAMDAAAEQQSSESMRALAEALGRADGFLLSDGGTPLAPNPRTLKGADGRVWIAAFSSVERAAARKTPNDGILRAPLPVICGTAKASGLSGVALNPGSAPWMLIEGQLLASVSATRGSGNPITMVDPRFAVTREVHVRADGGVLVDGTRRSIDELRSDLTALRAQSGLVQYSREDAESAPSEPAEATMRLVLDLIAELRLPVQLVQPATPDQIAQARDASRGRQGGM